MYAAFTIIPVVCQMIEKAPYIVDQNGVKFNVANKGEKVAKKSVIIPKSIPAKFALFVQPIAINGSGKFHWTMRFTVGKFGNKKTRQNSRERVSTGYLPEKNLVRS